MDHCVISLEHETIVNLGPLCHESPLCHEKAP